MPQSNNANLIFVFAVASWALTVISNVRYEFGRRSPWDHGHQDDVAFTPFTANLPAIGLYWLIMIIAQAFSVIKFFKEYPPTIAWHFITSNCLLLFWSYLFARGHYFWSEVIVILNFCNLLSAYVIGRTYRLKPLSKWFAVHVALIELPLLWSFYQIFWNGAVLFHARNILSRLVANILIWDFLLVPGLMVLLFGDYVAGFAGAGIAFSIGLGQLLTKVFALQWIFAFIIGGILLLLGVTFSFQSPPDNDLVDDQAPLLAEPSDV